MCVCKQLFSHQKLLALVLRFKFTKMLQWHSILQCHNLNTLGLISSLLKIGLPAGYP